MPVEPRTPPEPARPRRGVRRRRVAVALGVVALLLLALALLALPFRGVPAQARSAQDSLTAAAEELRAGNLDEAEAHVRAARADVDDVREATEGPGGRVWSLVPFAGSGVRDARRLATALHEATAAVEVGLETYRLVSGPGAALFVEGGVDIEVLEQGIAGLGRLHGHVRAARASLDEVTGTNLFVGDPMATARDEALAEVEPVAEDLARAAPLVETLPALLGAQEQRRYVVATLNPAEMRHSGGAMLTFAALRLDEGVLHRGPSRDTASNSSMFRPVRWEPVDGNPFRSPFRESILHANFAPSWPVSGEETLRAWSVLKNYEPDGLVVLDVVALSRLLEVTGPLDVAGAGTVTAENLVERTVGSYDEVDPADNRRRKALNRRLIPAFVDRLFGGVDLVDTVQALGEASRGRHFAMYLRDPDLQRGAVELGLDGDLSATEHDYLGTFTQNLAPSKTDYWQSKSIRSQVDLRPDGGARVRLAVRVVNGTPATAPTFASGYTDRRLHLRLAQFLPMGASVREASWGGRAFEPRLHDYFGRPFLTREAVLEPGGSSTLRLEYDVPSAAVVTGDRLAYHLDIDPHPTVVPERLDLHVRWPEGLEPTGLPAGWVRDGPRSAAYVTDALDGRHAWRLDGGGRGRTP